MSGATLLPTAVVGSYSMPGWLERVKNDYLHRRISRHDLDEIHDAAVKAAIKDQEVAGVDIVSDGELRRDNMIDYFAMRLARRADRPRLEALLLRLLRQRGPRPDAHGRPSGSATISASCAGSPTAGPRCRSPGPHSLVKRIRNEHYPSEEAFALDIARVMNLELRELVKAGATDLQIDEPYYSGFPEDLAWGDPRRQRARRRRRRRPFACTSATATATASRPGRAATATCSPPSGRRASISSCSSSRRRGEEDVALFKEFDPPFGLGLGVIDVKTHDVESPAIVAERIRKALEIVPAERLGVNPDCGCLHLPRDVAFAKLCAMVEGTRIVRKELGG